MRVERMERSLSFETREGRAPQDEGEANGKVLILRSGVFAASRRMETGLI
jgi:hypothetical protein